MGEGGKKKEREGQRVGRTGEIGKKEGREGEDGMGGSKGERRRKKRMEKRNKERRKGKKKGKGRKADGVGERERGRKKPQISAHNTDEGTSMKGKLPTLVPRHHPGPLLVHSKLWRFMHELCGSQPGQ